MILSELITRIADDSNTTPEISSVSERITREINRVCSEIWDGYRWSFRWRNYRFVTDVDATAGTVTATNGSRTISNSGANFLSTHVGWHLYFPGDPIQNWYKIRVFTSTSQLELDVPYQGTTGSGKSYILRHFDYVIPTEAYDLANITVTYGRTPVKIVEPTGIDIVGPTPIYNGYPLFAAIYSSDSLPTSYSTGTVSGTLNTQTLTGSGTSWLNNVYPGDLVTISTNKYTVANVDSDTQITLYNNQQVTSSAATYSIKRQFGRVLRIMWPSNQRYTLDIRALKKYAPLVNSNDTNELLYRIPNSVALKVSALEIRSQDDIRARDMERDADMNLQRARAEDDSLTTKDAVAPIFTYRMGSRYLYSGRIT